MEEVLGYLEEEGDGPLHLEGKGVAVKPDTDDEESLGEVLDREQGRKQRLLSATPCNMRGSHLSSCSGWSHTIGRP